MNILLGRLRQVLTNLLTNSIKFTSEGSITLRAVEEAEDEKTVRVRFSIEDEGMGIAESIRERLFQPFSQADSSTARRYGGTGLGLTISKNVGNHINIEDTIILTYLAARGAHARKDRSRLERRQGHLCLVLGSIQKGM
jgi:signal transduction histidine kinase